MPFLYSLRSSTTFTTLVVGVAIFTASKIEHPSPQLFPSNPPQDTFLYALIIPMCPFFLQERCHVPAHRVAFWTSMLLAAYGGAFLVTAPVAGMISDRWRCRRGLLWSGLIFLTGSTSLLYVARSLALLTLARALQGLSAAIVWVVGLALLAQTADGPKVGQALGYVCSALCLSLMLSPMLSGLLFHRGGYHAVYAMAFAVIGCDAVLRLLLLEKDATWCTSSSTMGSSSPVSSEDATSPTMLVKGLIKRTDPESEPLSISPSPSTLYHLLRSRQVWTCMLVNFVVQGVVVACDAILPLFVAHTFRWNAFQIGLVLFALYGPNFVLGYPIGKTSSRRSRQHRSANSHCRQGGRQIRDSTLDSRWNAHRQPNVATRTPNSFRPCRSLSGHSAPGGLWKCLDFDSRHDRVFKSLWRRRLRAKLWSLQCLHVGRFDGRSAVFWTVIRA